MPQTLDRSAPLPTHPNRRADHPRNDLTNIGASNGLIRQYLPKGTEITDHQPYLTAIAEELNERSRAVLGYRTPREALEHMLINGDVAWTL